MPCTLNKILWYTKAKKNIIVAFLGFNRKMYNKKGILDFCTLELYKFVYKTNHAISNFTLPTQIFSLLTYTVLSLKDHPIMCINLNTLILFHQRLQTSTFTSK